MNIIGSGEKRKDWVEGFKSDAKILFKSFEPNQKVIKYVKKSLGEKFKDGCLLVFDYNNQIKKMADRNSATVIKITNSQIHTGRGSNIMTNSDSSKEKKIVGAIVSVFVIIIGAFFTNKLGLTSGPDSVTTSNPKNISQEDSPVLLKDNSNVGKLRSLDPLETGKKISELPNGVYFFAGRVLIQYEIKNVGSDIVTASGYPSDYKFELQKSNNRYYLVGFVSDETYSKQASASSEHPLTAILYPISWGGSTKTIAIPFDAITSINYRDIEIDAKTTLSVFDVGFTEAIANPEVHR